MFCNLNRIHKPWKSHGSLWALALLKADISHERAFSLIIFSSLVLICLIADNLLCFLVNKTPSFSGDCFNHFGLLDSILSTCLHLPGVLGGLAFHAVFSWIMYRLISRLCKTDGIFLVVHCFIKQSDCGIHLRTKTCLVSHQNGSVSTQLLVPFKNRVLHIQGGCITSWLEFLLCGQLYPLGSRS